MARKDVDLVIRAKDQAAKVVDQITAAINDFSEAQKKADKRTGATESALGSFGAALGNLTKQLGGLSVGDKLAQGMKKAETALASAETRAESARAELGQLEQKMREAGTSSETFSKKLAGGNKALDRQKAKLKELKDEQTKLTSAQRAAGSAVESLTQKHEAFPATLQREEASLARIAATNADLRESMLGVENASERQRVRMEQSDRNLQRQVDKLARLRAEYASLPGQIRAAASAETIFAGETAKVADAVAKQERVVGKVEQNVKGLTVTVRELGKEQGRLGTRISKSQADFEKFTAQVNEAENELVQFAQDAGKADAALAELASRSKLGLSEELKQQRLAMLRAKKEATDYTARVGELRAEMGRVGVPTRQMVEDLERTIIAARESKAVLAAQREALELMGRAYREAGTDVEKLRAAEDRFIAIQRELAAAMGTAAAAAKKQDAELDKLHADYIKVSESSERAARSTRRVAEANERATTFTQRMAAAYREFYGDTRRSLSLLQRIRGEVLSLVAAYGGLYAAIEVLRGSVDAVQTLEAATARLNVAVGEDQAGQEMDFLRRNADRLGISLGVLAQEYSKFSIATKDTALEGAATRKIFLSVAEAARVNRSSTQEMAGVFTALTQIVSKGAVQMEELRQQLGDRLPGAINIMADGLGITTAELIKMMEAGEITAEALVPFAEELGRRFGPGLADSLAGTAVALGRLQNAAFQALVTFGQQGFLRSFADLLNTISETIQSADFEEFSGRVSRALAVIVDGLGFAIENFRLFSAILAGFIGLKIAPFFKALYAGLAGIGKAAPVAASGLAATRAAAAGSAGAMYTAGRAAVALTASLRALLGATGIGLAVAAISAGIAYWSTGAKDATEALSTHKDIVDEVRNLYDLVGGKVGEFRDKLKEISDLSLNDAIRNAERLEDALQGAIKDFNAALADEGGTFGTRFFGYEFVAASKEMQDAVKATVAEFNAGNLTTQQFTDKLEDISVEFRDGSAANARYADALVDSAKIIEELSEKLGEAQDIIKAMRGDTDEGGEAFDRLGNKAKEAAEKVETMSERAARFGNAMDELAAKIPAVKAQLDFLEESNALKKLYDEAVSAATGVDQIAAAFLRYREAQDGLTNSYLSSAVGGSLVDRIIGVESGGNANAKNPNSTATGLGQFIESTWLRMFKQYFPEYAAGKTNGEILELRKNAEFSRKMTELYLRENAEHLQRAGAAITDANLYLAHFLGPGGAARLINSAPGTPVANVLGADQIAANQSILGGGATRESVIRWAQQKVGVSREELSVQEELQRIEAKRAEDERRAAEKAEEERQRQREATAERLADGQAEIDQQQLINAGKEREAEVQEAIRAARAKDPNITEEEIAQIREQTERLYDLKKAKEAADKADKDALTTLDKAKQAEQEVNNLVAQRAALKQQLETAQQQGATEDVARLNDEIDQLNAKIISAIDNATKMWEAVGGSQADAAIAKLGVARQEAQGLSDQGGRTYLQWDRVSDLFVGGLAGAFDTFAQKVAAGENAFEAARDAFLQFAADFLREIAMMILKQAIFNALKAAFGGTGFGNLIGLPTGHTGGIVGSGSVGAGRNGTRTVNPMIFAAARRFHEGGIPGLAPGEVPIIAKQDEEIITRDDPRHALNGGKSGGGTAAPRSTKIVNAFDAPGFLEAALGSDIGQEVLLNFVRANKAEVNTMLES